MKTSNDKPGIVDLRAVRPGLAELSVTPGYRARCIGHYQDGNAICLKIAIVKKDQEN